MLEYSFGIKGVSNRWWLRLLYLLSVCFAFVATAGWVVVLFVPLCVLIACVYCIGYVIGKDTSNWIEDNAVLMFFLPICVIIFLGDWLDTKCCKLDREKIEAQHGYHEF